MTIRNAMVLAAGLGTRLRPITDTIPKPLVAIGNKPMIDYALDALTQAGITTIAVNVHHHAEQMEKHLAGYTKAKILISNERERLMDSGGGLAKGLKLLPSGPVMVMNADLFWLEKPDIEQTALQRLAKFFDAENMDMAMLCVKLEHTTGHNGKKDFNLDSEGRLSRYREGDENPVVYAGAVVMHARLLADAPAEPFNLNIYFDRAIGTGRLFGTMLDGEWITVGTPDAIEAAESTIRRFNGRVTA